MTDLTTKTAQSLHDKWCEQMREKVREMCAVAVEKIESGNDGWNYALVKAYTAIRQLDLTKDLAHSSTEEHGKPGV